MLYAFFHYGFSLGHFIWTGYLFAGISIFISVMIWGLWAAPKSKRRLPMPYQAFLRIFMFGMASLSLYFFDYPIWSYIVLTLAVITQWVGWLTNSN
jgi:hypothetical protein